jgi:hypothetical protein
LGAFSVSTSALAGKPAVHSTAGYAIAAELMRRHPSLTRARLYRMVVVGTVRRLLLPGQAPRYSIRDVDAVMRQAADERR